jgi:flagellar basal body rod protein FlgG
VKPDGIDSAVRALRYWERRQEVMSHNLANVSTTGFKGERVFARLLADQATGPEARSRTDFKAGTVAPTGRPLDLAIEGDGFFVVRTPGGDRLTRAGAFSVDDTGTLMDGAGNEVLDRGRRSVVLPPGQVEVTQQGEVMVDNAVVAVLRLERAPDDAVLEREGSLYYVPAEERVLLRDGDVKVRQGHLEESNVNAVGALVDMIEIQRSYQAVQRSVQAADDVMDTIANDLGRLG